MPVEGEIIRLASSTINRRGEVRRLDIAESDVCAARIFSTPSRSPAISSSSAILRTKSSAKEEIDSGHSTNTELVLD